MKHLRKVMALVLATFVALVVAKPALAVDHKITITNTNTNMSIDGKTYNAYKLFDSTHVGTGATAAYAYSMSTSSQFYSADLVAAQAPTEDGLAKVLRTYFTFEAVPGDTTKVNVKNINYPNKMTEPQARAFADAIQKYIAGKTPTASGTASGETAVINLPADAAGVGYYIVTGDVKPKDPANPTDTVVSAVILTNEDPTADIKPKAVVPPFNKKTTKVTEGTTVVDNALLDNKGKAAVAKVGSTVSYELDTEAPDLTGYSDYTFYFGDAISAGLDYVTDSFKLKVGDADAVAVTPVIAADGKSFRYTFPYATLKTYTAGTKLVLTYDCTVNDNALTYDYENNTASLTYSRSPYDDVENETPKQKTYVIDLNLDVDKINTQQEKLTGAKFKLYRMNGTTKEFYKWDTTAKKVTWTTEANADVFETENGKLKQQVRGLDKGTYFFLETEPPTGYNLLTQPVQVDIVVTEDVNGETVTYTAKYNNEAATVTNGSVNLTTQTQEAGKQPVAAGVILNQSGTELPSTGGMGTTILYTIGGIMLVGGAIALVSKKRVANMEK